MRTASAWRAVAAAALAVALLCLCGLPARAAPAQTLTVTALGFDGRVRMGAWIPVWIDVLAPDVGIDGTLTVAAAAPAGTPVVQFAAPVRAAPGAKVSVFVPAILYDARTPGAVTLSDAHGTVGSIPLPRVVPADDIVAILSGEPLGADALLARGSRMEIVYLSPEQLPLIWQAYEAIRLVVIRNLDERRLVDAQRQALQQWVWSGGRLLVMPSGDDVRHLQGPTLRDLIPVTVMPRQPSTSGASPLVARPGSGAEDVAGVRAIRWRAGRGRVSVWERDAGDPAWRGNPDDRRAWEALLADPPTPAAFDLDTTLAPQRPVPGRTQALVGALILGYLMAARRLSRLVSVLRPAAVLLAACILVAASVAAWRIAVFARADASGVVSSVLIEALPGTGQAIVALAARTVTSHPGEFTVATRPELLVRPVPPAPVTVARDGHTRVLSRHSGLRLAATGIVTPGISGTFAPQGEGGIATVVNRTGARLEPAWIYQNGRVHPIGPVGATAEIMVDGQRWLPRDRLQRTEPNHALLMWAFSHLESDAILKAIPTWLVGWLRDPAFSLTWEGRSEVTPHLVLVSLTAP